MFDKIGYMHLKVFSGTDKELLKRQVYFFRYHHPEFSILNIEEDLMAYATKPSEKKQYRFRIFYDKKTEG